MRITQGLFSSVGKMTKLYSNLPESYIKRAMEKVCLFDGLFYSNKTTLGYHFATEYQCIYASWGRVGTYS